MPDESSQNAQRMAIDVAEHCPLTDEAQTLLTPQMASDKYLALLISKELYSDAIRFTAFHLPKRDAVWWGALCLWNAYRPSQDNPLPDSVDAVFRALTNWVQEPNEKNRRAAEAAGREAGIASTHGQLAMAAFFSEGSISRPGLPEVLAKPWHTAKNVAGAVVAASKKGEPSEVVANQRLFLVLASELSQGQLPWNSSEREADVQLATSST